MLHLHLGWPKTGTKTLQAALFDHRDELADAGVVYPDRWRRQLLPEIPDGSHNALVDVIDAVPRAGPQVGEFLAFLAKHSGSEVVLSSETVTLRAAWPQTASYAAELLVAVGARTPVSCVWTLRRFDDFIASLYPQLISVGMRLPPPPTFFASVDPGTLFAGMRQIAESVDSVAYVEYRADGAHNAELLAALAIPAPTRGELERSAVEPRLNPSLSHKQVVALLELESLSERAGVAFDAAALRSMFRTGEFEFADDGPCRLAGREERRELRDRALRAAGEEGLDSYARFFADSGEEEPSGEEEVRARPVELSDEDVERLAGAYAASRAGGA